MEKCRRKLSHWSKTKFSHEQKKIAELHEILNNLKKESKIDLVINSIRKVERDLKQALMDQESFWRLISKALWFKGRDKNTKYFPSKASQRRRNNMITGLIKEDRFWTHDMSETEDANIRCFSKLFTSFPPSKIPMPLFKSQMLYLQP